MISTYQYQLAGFLLLSFFFFLFCICVAYPSESRFIVKVLKHFRNTVQNYLLSASAADLWYFDLK